MKRFMPPKNTIGPSQLATILGMTRWCTRDQLINNLKYGYWDYPTEKKQFGCDNEHIVLAFYEKYKKIKVQEASFAYACKDQFIGKADGLVGDDGGVEIKCHPDGPVLESIPSYYLVQIVAYMFLYDRKWWDFVSCSFDAGKIKKVNIIRVYWQNHAKTWEHEWYPELIRLFQDLN